MTSTRAAPMSAENIVSLHDEAVAMPVILSGVLDAKVAELREIQADLVTRQGIVKTVEEAKALLTATEEQSKVTLRNAKEVEDAAAVTAKEMTDAAKVKMDAALALENETLKERAKLQAASDAFGVGEAEQIKRFAAQQKELDQRTKAMDEREQILAAGEHGLEVLRAEFNKKLEALKA